MKHNLKKIITFISIFLIVVFLGASYVNAINPTQFQAGQDYTEPPDSHNGTVVSLSHGNGNTYIGWQNTYCGHFGFDAPRNHNYEVAAHITIKDGKATGISNLVKNKVDLNDNTFAIKKMSYILWGGENSKYGNGYDSTSSGVTSYRQNALWKYLGKWFGDINSLNKIKFGWSSYRPEDEARVNARQDNGLIAAAEEYANSTTNGAWIQNQSGSTVVTSNKIAGPFKFKFEGEITSIEVYDSSNKNIANEVKFCKNSDGSGTYNELSEIKSPSSFYIKNDTTKKLKSVKVNVKATSPVLNGDIWLLTNENAQGAQEGIVAIPTTPSYPSASSPMVNIEEQGVGKIKIIKKDSKTGKALNGAQFIIKVAGDKFVTQDSSGKVGYEGTRSSAKVFTARKHGDEDGTFTSPKLRPGKYHVYEVKAPDGYKLEDQVVRINTGATRRYESGTDKNYVQVAENVEIKEGDTSTISLDVVNTKPDEPTPTPTQPTPTQPTPTPTGATTPTPTPTRATTPTPTPTVPTPTPTVPTPTPTPTPTTTPTPTPTVPTPTPTPVQQNVTVSGYVWVDEPDGKGNNTNGLYNQGSKDFRLKDVIVILRRADGTEVERTKTNDRGEYTFNNKIKSDEVKEYYIEFDYSNTNGGAYRRYTPVPINKNAANGSKALSDSLPRYDRDLSGKATTNKNSPRLAEFYTQGATSITNINLGIRGVPYEYNIVENLADVTITIRGQTYKYNYGGSGNTNLIYAPKVKYQSVNSVTAFTRGLYPSDITYNSTDSKENLKVYVKYRIDITDTTTLNYPEYYQEKMLTITSLKNTFDAKRYQLSENETNWTSQGEGQAIYNKGSFNIAKGKTDTRFITFRVKDAAIQDILQHPDGLIEDLNFPTKAISKGYHVYQRKDYSWQNTSGAVQEHITLEEERDAKAPYLIFTLEKQRTLTGKVFEDGKDAVRSSNGEYLGDGKYSQNENNIKGVKVELLDINDNEKDLSKLTPTKLYVVDGPENGPKKLVTPLKDAVTTTTENGTYSFEGVVPGYYYLRFTYGDGTQEIYDPSGKKVEDVTLSSKEYKSTIVTNEAAANALGYKPDKYEDYTWYLYLGDENSSVAKDNLVTRQTINNGTGQAIDAESARIKIKVESTAKNDKQVAVNNNKQSEAQTETVRGLNFGIIKQPQLRIRAEKIISNIKLTNAQGNIIFEGNPEKDKGKMKGVADLDNIENGGSTYTRVETAEENIYGSTITITYKISITNESDLNYYGAKYYWYGDPDGLPEVTLEIKQIKDYLDSSLTCLTQRTSDNKEVILVDGRTIETKDGDIVRTSKVLQIAGWKNILFSIHGRNGKNKELTTDTTEIVAQKILSDTDQELEFINRAAIEENDVIPAPDPDDPDSTKDQKIQTITKNVVIEGPIKDGQVLLPEAKVTLTPPTGADLQSIVIYTIVGIVALVTLAGGIIFIKKKVI